MNALNEMQRSIMLFITNWVKTQKTPVPRKIIFEQMAIKGFKYTTIRNALETLTKNHFIRGSRSANQIHFVQLRTIS